MFADVINEPKVMWILKILIYLSGALAIILTVLPFLKFSVWWIRIGDFPRLQIAFVCVVAAVLLFFTSNQLGSVEIVFLASLAACAIYQLYCVLPYLPFYPKQVQKISVPIAENTIKILIFNVFV